MAFSSTNLFLSKFQGHLNWILRRASAGFVAGLIAWFFIPIVSRILSQGSSPYFVFPLTGFMGGAFLGSVDGMVEESTPKTIRGAVVGGIGGIIGGVLFAFLKDALPADLILISLFVFWAVAGGFVGSISAMWEGQSKKLSAGIIAGFIGGGIGGYLGAAVHANLLQQLSPESWIFQRFLESMVGGLIGLSLWFAIGFAERFFIFKRRFVPNATHKQCDLCDWKNPLMAWYCGECGSVLQVSVPMAKLNLPRFGTLNRVREMFQFLSRLSAATGFIASFVALFIFLPGDPFMVLVVFVMIALLSYTFQVIFSSIAESLEIAIKK